MNIIIDKQFSVNLEPSLIGYLLIDFRLKFSTKKKKLDMQCKFDVNFPSICQ